MHTSLSRSIPRTPFIRFLSQKIVPFERNHFEKIQAIALENMPKLAGNKYSCPKEMFGKHIRPLLHASSCFVATSNNKPIGFITFSPHVQTCIFSNLEFGKIEHLAIDKRIRSKGIGSCLVHHAIEKLSTSFVTLEVNDMTLERFYKRLGFKRVFSVITKDHYLATMTCSSEEKFIYSIVMRMMPFMKLINSYSNFYLRLAVVGAGIIIINSSSF
jgi:ribosomal protein S18 acetylase RimI-like enzyme